MRKFYFFLLSIGFYLLGGEIISAQQWTSTGTVVAGGNGYGSEPNQFSQLMGVAVDDELNVYVPDFGNHRIQKWAPGATEGITIAGGLGWNSSSAGLALPTAILIDENNTLYISDSGNNRVQKWEEGATEGVTIAGGNGLGNEFNQLYWQGGIFMKGNDLYIMDSGNSRVMKWTIGESEGEIVAGGSWGSGLNQIGNPTLNGSVAVDDENNMIISEYSNKRFTKWSEGATEGVLIADLTEYEDPRPSGIILLDGSKMLLAYNNGVALWEDNQFQHWVVDPASTEVNTPTAICFDSNMNLYVADYGNNRVKRFDYICELTATVDETDITVCEGEDVVLSVNVSEDDSTIYWYDSEDSDTPIYTGNNYEIEEIVGTTSYWVEAYNQPCTSERIEITVTVIAAPELEAETAYTICSGNPAQLYAYSEGNVIFWYENENDTEYIYHGNNFITEPLTESTTYWVESYNLTTGCKSERIEVTVTVNPIPEAPVTIEIVTAEPGQTLADLEADIEAEGELTWYADEYLTVELPNSTVVEDNSVYFVTQTVNGCESTAAVIEVELLGASDINNSAFAYYPNPVKNKLNFTGTEKVEAVQIYDMSGKLLINQNSKSGLTEVDVNALPKGTYIVKVQAENAQKVFKIVKN